MPRLKRSLLLALVLAGIGCMPMYSPTSDGGGTHEDMAGGGSNNNSNPDALPATGRTFAEQCDSNGQCTSMLCTQDSYDRLTHPICTSKCDPAAPSSPQCPNGCNMKGYCRLPTM